MRSQPLSYINLLLPFVLAFSLFSRSEYSQGSDYLLNISGVLFGETRILNIHPESESGAILSKVPLNKMIRLRVTLPRGKTEGGKDLQLASFSAEMPAHRHGMVTKATVKKLSPGVFLIEGVKFHMPGEWALKFQMEFQGKTQDVAMSLKL
jgi:hypothetical protein